MKINKNKILTFISFFFIPTLFAQSGKGIVVDKIIAQVNDQIILQSELEMAYQEYLHRKTKENTITKSQLFENMLVSKMLLAKAEIDSVGVSKEEVEASLQQRLRYIVGQVGSEARLEQYFGRPLVQIKKELKANIETQIITARMQEAIIKNVTIAPWEVKNFLHQMPVDSLPYVPLTVQVGQIVKYLQVNSKRQLAIIEQVQALKTRIQQGEDFGVLAKQYSEDVSSADKSGELGFWKIGELTPAYEAAALALSPGEIANPVVTPAGVHLIQLIDRKGNRYNTRHILIKYHAPALNAKEALHCLDSVRTLLVTQTLTFDKAVQQFSEHKPTARTRGWLTDADGYTKISANELPKAIRLAIDTLAQHDITQPALFKTQDNRSAASIIFLKEKIPSHALDLERDYEQTSQAALQAKKTNALNAWLAHTKTDVSVIIDDDYQAL